MQSELYRALTSIGVTHKDALMVITTADALIDWSICRMIGCPQRQLPEPDLASTLSRALEASGLSYEAATSASALFSKGIRDLCADAAARHGCWPEVVQ